MKKPSGPGNQSVISRMVEEVKDRASSIGESISSIMPGSESHS